MLPVFLNVQDRLCLVVGGGRVGRRKAAVLANAGAKIRLVCLEKQPEDAGSAAVEWLTEAYRSDHLNGAALVFAAATPPINQRVLADAQERGVWVNVADDPEASDFYLPAVLRRGGFQVAISTGGAAPALARVVRARLEEQFDDAFGCWADLLAEVRPIILAQVADPARRQALFEQLCQWHWLDRIRGEGVEAVREALRAVVAGITAAD